MRGAPPVRGASVLQSRRQIRRARRELGRLGADFSGSGLRDRLTRRASRVLGSSPPKAFRSDPAKNWDILLTIRAVLAETRPADAVLDLGAVGSAILPALRRLGFSDLHGIDLDPAVTRMPDAGSIDYRVGDMMSTPWPDGSFAAITAISVIEHGLDRERLLHEVRRLLRPGGIFAFSTDFWPEKIETEGISAFGLPWTIFDAEEISDFFAAAGDAGLRLEAPLQALETEPASRPIEWNERKYTFLHAMLRRD